MENADLILIVLKYDGFQIDASSEQICFLALLALQRQPSRMWRWLIDDMILR